MCVGAGRVRTEGGRVSARRRVRVGCRVQCAVCSVQGVGCSVQCAGLGAAEGRRYAAIFRSEDEVSGFWGQVSGAGFRVYGYARRGRRQMQKANPPQVTVNLWRLLNI